MRGIPKRLFVVALAAVLGLAGAASGAVTPQTIATNVDRAWVTTDRAGTSHIVFVSTVSSQSTLYYASATRGAPRFSTPRAIPVAATGVDFAGPFILQDPAPSNRLVIIVQRCCVTGQSELFAVTSLDGGATWSPSQPIAETGFSVNATSGAVSLVAASPTTIYAANGNPSLRLITIPTTLTPLQATAGQTPISPSSYNGSVVVDPTGTPVFAFGDTQRTFVRVGVTGPDLLAGENSGGAFLFPTIKIASGARGVGALVMSGSSTTATNLAFRSLSAGALQPPITLNSAGDRSPGLPFLATDQSGGFHAIWRTGAGDLVYRRSPDGRAWTASTALLVGGAPFNPIMSASAPGEGWVVWRDGVERAKLLAIPLPALARADDPAVPDTSGIERPIVTRRGSSIFVTPRKPSLAKLRRTKCVNVRVQTTRPARINVAIYSGNKSIRLFGQTVVRFTKPGKRVVCVRVPLRAKSFDVRQPFRFAFAVKQGAVARPKEPTGALTLTGFTKFA